MFNKKLLSRKDDEGGRVARKSQRDNPIMTMRGGARMSNIVKTMKEKKHVVEPFSVNENPTVTDAVFEVLIRKINSSLEAAADGHDALKKFLEKSVTEIGNAGSL